METILPPRPLLNRAQLLKWLGVSDFWLRERLETDPGFPWTDIANEGSERRTLRFEVHAVAEHLGIPVPPREHFEAPTSAVLTARPAAA